MADYLTQFSCLFDIGSAENAAAAMAIRDQLQADLGRDEGQDIGFDMSIDTGEKPGNLWISSDEYGEPEHVVEFVKLCAGAFNLKGLWGFAWSLSCSKPCLDAFGGGAQVIDLSRRESVAWVDCAHWLGEQLATADEQQGGPA